MVISVATTISDSESVVKPKPSHSQSHQSMPHKTQVPRRADSSLPALSDFVAMEILFGEVQSVVWNKFPHFLSIFVWKMTLWKFPTVGFLGKNLWFVWSQVLVFEVWTLKAASKKGARIDACLPIPTFLRHLNVRDASKLEIIQVESKSNKLLTGNT